MKQLTLVHLYPSSMNTYGDVGNVVTLIKRCEWRNINVSLHNVEIGQNYDFNKADIVFAGGGQDSSQVRISPDLQQKKNSITEAVNNYIVFLIICGTYQLFGHYFRTSEKEYIPGISVFDCITEASSVRKIGNVVLEHEIKNLEPKTLVGFENHSGNTRIKNLAIKKYSYNENTVPLGRVVRGIGNNGEDGFEGARYKNCFGTYLHGSLLPKNPHFADYLISLALDKKYGENTKIKKLDDRLENMAHQYILTTK